MDLQDVLFSSDISSDRKAALYQFVLDHELVDPYLSILVRTESNNDVSESQSDGDDFTYRDATLEDILQGSFLGYYEYFADYVGGVYTGHYYQGDETKFAAIVVDPPAYVEGTSF